MVWSQRRWMFLREHSANGRRCRGPRRRWWSGWGAAAKWSARTPSGLPAKYDQSLHFTIGNIAVCASIVYIQWVLVQVLGRFYNESYSEWHSYTHLTISRHIRTCRLFGAWTELYPQQWHVLLERYSIGFTNEITIDVNRFSIIVVLWVKLTCLWVSRTGQITEDCRSYHLSFFSHQPSALLPPVGSLSSGLVSHEVINHYFAGVRLGHLVLPRSLYQSADESWIWRSFVQNNRGAQFLLPQLLHFLT